METQSSQVIKTFKIRGEKFAILPSKNFANYSQRCVDTMKLSVAVQFLNYIAIEFELKLSNMRDFRIAKKILINCIKCN